MKVGLRALRSLVRTAYKVRGAARLADLVRRKLAARGGVVEVNDFDSDLTMTLDLSEHIGSQIFWRGAYSPGPLAAFDRLLNPDSVVLDIGANIGEFTLFAAKRARGGAVHAFEPVKETFARLTANVRANHFDNVVLNRLALGSVSGVATVVGGDLNWDDGTVNRGVPSVTPGATGIGEKVSIATLDGYLAAAGVARVDVVKIDIEGGELEAFRGAPKMLQNMRPDLLVEVNEETCRRAGHAASELTGLLEKAGYRGRTIRDDGALEDDVRLDAGGYANVVFRHAQGKAAGRGSR